MDQFLFRMDLLGQRKGHQDVACIGHQGDQDHLQVGNVLPDRREGGAFTRRCVHQQ